MAKTLLSQVVLCLIPTMRWGHPKVLGIKAIVNENCVFQVYEEPIGR